MKRKSNGWWKMDGSWKGKERKGKEKIENEKEKEMKRVVED